MSGKSGRCLPLLYLPYLVILLWALSSLTFSNTPPLKPIMSRFQQPPPSQTQWLVLSSYFSTSAVDTDDDSLLLEMLSSLGFLMVLYPGLLSVFLGIPLLSSHQLLTMCQSQTCNLLPSLQPVPWLYQLPSLYLQPWLLPSHTREFVRWASPFRYLKGIKLQCLNRTLGAPSSQICSPQEVFPIPVYSITVYPTAWNKS